MWCCKWPEGLWNNEESLKFHRRTCFHNSRKAQRSRGRDNLEEFLASFKQARRELSNVINNSKRRHFKIDGEQQTAPSPMDRKIVTAHMPGNVEEHRGNNLPNQSSDTLQIERTIEASIVPPVANLISLEMLVQLDFLVKKFIWIWRKRKPYVKYHNQCD